MRKKSGEVDAVTRIYDLLLWIVPKLDKFPRSQKFLVGDRIENLLLDTLELLLDAAFSKKQGGVTEPGQPQVGEAALSRTPFQRLETDQHFGL